MLRFAAYSTLAAVLLLALDPSRADGQRPTATSGTATAEGLAVAYVTALRSHDALAERLVMHPATLNCASSSDTMYSRRQREMGAVRAGRMNGPYKVLFRTVSDSMRDPMAYEPVRPSMQVQIDFTGTPLSVIRRVVQTGGRWYVVMPCITPAGLDAMRAMMRAK